MMQSILRFGEKYGESKVIAFFLIVLISACTTRCLGVQFVGDNISSLSSVALNPRSNLGGRKLFTELSSAKTGLIAVNRYSDPEMWRDHYREFTLGAVGTGISIGDFDNDGRPDVFVVCKVGPNHLFRNLGNFKFEDITDRAGVAGPLGAWNTGACFADVNDDGLLDIYVLRFGAPNLLYINQGNGRFRQEGDARGLALTEGSVMAAFCDYDRDGWLDVYILTNLLDAEQNPHGQRDHLFHNNRDGTFTEVTEQAGISGQGQGHSATWWDYDEDGWPDLYVANDFAEADILYHNNHDGTFTNVLNSVVPHTPYSSMGADLGDLDNDGHLDLLVADMAATSRYKDHRGMARLRAGLAENIEPYNPAPQYPWNSLFLGTGGGRVLEAAELTGLQATDWTWSIRFEDLDLDGRLDAYFTNGMVRELHNTDLDRRIADSQTPGEKIRLIKSSPLFGERHLVYRNLGDLRFEDVSAAWGLDHVGVSFGAAFGDLDGDGDLDLIFSNYDGELTVCRNNADSGHAVIFDLRGTVSNRFGVGALVRIETADGTQMRTLTLARGSMSTSEPIVHFGLGSITLIDRVTIEWPSGRYQVLTKLAVDRRYTIVEPAESSPLPAAKGAPQFVESAEGTKLSISNRESAGRRMVGQPNLPFYFDRPGPAAVFADFNGDDNDDLALGGIKGEHWQLFSSTSDSHFNAYGNNWAKGDSKIADGPLLAFDADGDGDMDLLVTKANDSAKTDAEENQPELWLNDGRGKLTPAPAGILPPLPISVGAVAAADFNHSGRLSIFIGGRIIPGQYPHPPRSALLVWCGDRYIDLADKLAPSLAKRGMVTGALWSDFDGDGWIDLLVTYDWGAVTCYRNVNGQRFEDVTDKLGFSQAGVGWWRSIASADFNGDGKPDYVVGNVGLNTRYRASVAEPAVLYSDVVLDSSAPQLVEAQYEKGNLYPLINRENFISAFPSLARRYSTAESYAKATLQELVPPSTLGTANKLEATQFQSGVFLSQQDGTYKFSPLPRLAQIAPINGIIAGDFDGDGRADILLVGNSYAPAGDTGRFDGGIGWLLRGNGAGAFTVVQPSDSGFIVPGDARALVISDVNRDGCPDFFVTRNNDRSLLFLNRSQPGRHSFGVALRGKPGNPTAVGARLRLRLTDGSTQTSEITAGSGCFSQSTSTIFFGYSDPASPVSLHVRWPNGREMEENFSKPPAGLIQLHSP